MAFDYWTLLTIPLIAGLIAGLILKLIPIDGQSLYSYLKKRYKKSPDNYLTDIVTPSEIEVGEIENISVTFHGSLKDGFLTCRIQDSTGDFNYCENRTTVRDLDDGRKIGKLNFQNETHTYRWAIQPKPTYQRGNGKLMILVCETRDRFKDGHWIEDRPHIALEIREVLLV